MRAAAATVLFLAAGAGAGAEPATPGKGACHIPQDDCESSNFLQFRAKKVPESFALPFAYSIMGPGGTLVARLILPLTEACPEALVVSRGGRVEERLPVVVRAEPAVGHIKFQIDDEVYDSMEGLDFSVASPHPAFTFADRVCEARLADPAAAQTAHFVVGARKLTVPLPPADPTSVVVLGDTGLRIKTTNDGWCKIDMGSPKTLYNAKTCPAGNLTSAYDPTLVSGMFQRADESIDPALNGWPFRKVANAASLELQGAGGRALVVHVGDYTYRHEACPAPFPTALTPDQEEQRRIFGDCTGAGAKWGDTSDGWAADFFEPAATLLAAAPWIVLRGNHESCKRGGMGWFRYLDPATNSSSADAHSVYPWCIRHTPAYSVDFAHDQWLVLDTNDVTDEDVSVDSFSEEAFTAQDAAAAANSAVPSIASCESADSGSSDVWIFKGLNDLVSPGKRHWIAMHRPIFALTFGIANNSPELLPFQCELANAVSLAGIAVPDVPAVVSGHVHFFQLLQYAQGVAQLVFGNGGTQLKTPLNGKPIGLDQVAGKNITMLGDAIVHSPTVGEWGYGVFKIAAKDAAPIVTAKFLTDAGFPGTTEVTTTLPPRTFSVQGTGWRTVTA